MGRVEVKNDLGTLDWSVERIEGNRIRDFFDG